MPNSIDYFQKLIDYLNGYYKGNERQLEKVKDFERRYVSKDAIEWYTKDSFLYRLLNSALRRFDIQTLFLFAFFLKDIEYQLEKEHQQYLLQNQSKIEVYRGQMMSKEEVQQLEDNKNSPWIINNSYLSTTFNRCTALTYLNQSPHIGDDDEQSVLFEIEVNPLIKSRCYSKISHLSYFAEEEELIFAFGNRFSKILTFYNPIEYIYIVKLQLNSNYRIKEKDLFQSSPSRKMLKKSLSLLNSMVDQMSIEMINLIFNHLVELYPEDNQWITAWKLDYLSKIYFYQKNFNEALIHSNDARQTWNNFLEDKQLNCYVDIAQIHSNLSHYYHYSLHDQIKAEQEYLNSISYFKLGLKNCESDFERMKIYEELSLIERHRIRLDGYSINDTNMITTYEQLSIANMFNYYSDDQIQFQQTLKQLFQLKIFLQQFDEALNISADLLNIYLKEPFQFDLFTNLLSVVDQTIDIFIEEKNKDYLSAIQYQLIKHRFIEKHFIYVGMDRINGKYVNQGDLAQSYIQLAVLYLSIKRYEEASISLTEALALLKEFGRGSIPTNVNQIRNYQLQEQLAARDIHSQDYDQAYDHLNLALTFLQHQTFMLEGILKLGLKDPIASIKYHTNFQKLLLKQKDLEEKMKSIEKSLSNCNQLKVKEQEEDIKNILLKKDCTKIDVILVSGCLEDSIK